MKPWLSSQGAGLIKDFICEVPRSLVRAFFSSELIEFGFRSDTRSRSETFIHFEDCRDATYSLNFARDLVRPNILPT